VWNDHFSPAERKELGDEPFLAWKHNGGTAGMWAVAKEVSRERALVDIAYALDWLETAKCEWLLEVIGEKTATVRRSVGTCLSRKKPPKLRACRAVRCGRSRRPSAYHGAV
jgi:hypothetical protein